MSEAYILEESCMAVVLFGDRILATRELIYGKEAVSLPKGHIEAGESHADTAIRECFEETDIVLKETDVVGEVEPYTVQFIDHHLRSVSKVIYPVVFRIDRCGEPRPKETRMLEARFLDVKEFLVVCSYDNVKQIVRQAIEL